MAAQFLNALQPNIGTAPVDVLTAASGSTAIGMSVANTYTDQINVDVTLTSGGVTCYIVKGAPVPKGGTLVAIGGDQKVVLKAGDKISVKSDVANSADAIISYLQA